MSDVSCAPRQRYRALGVYAVVVAFLAALGNGGMVSPSRAADSPTGDVERGRYVFIAGGCYACHTDEKHGAGRLSGGPPLVTPFGTFYAPNITPDDQTGIGRWTDADFLRAMRQGISPKDQNYYPVFPYTAYSQASDRDLLDLKAYLFAQPAIKRNNRPHQVSFPFSFRSLLWFWKALNFDGSRWHGDETRSEAWNRGSYLVNALSHCGECHTPRGILGGLDRTKWLAGARIADDVAPNLTPHRSGLAKWGLADISFALEQGITPDFDVLGGSMAEVVRNSTSKLTAADRTAIATYLKALPPLPSAVTRTNPPSRSGK